MAASVILNEQKVVNLLRQFIQEAELDPSNLLANGEQRDLPQLPTVITSLRNEILVGNWNKSLQQINSLAASSSDLSSLKYSICKQRYLESIDALFSNTAKLKGNLKSIGKDEVVKYVNPQQLKLVTSHLKALEGLCSQEDYFKLSFLISCPDLRTHPSYFNWTVQSGRLQTASSVCQKVLKLKYPSFADNHCFPASRPKRNNRLLQLVAKGILYEKCESLLQHQTDRRSKENSYEKGEILNLHSWLTHLPNEVLQIPVHKLSLCIDEQCCVKPDLGCDRSSPVQQYVSSNGHIHTSTNTSITTTTTTAATTATTTINDVDPPEVRESEKTSVASKNGTTPQHLREMEDDRKTKETVTDGEDNVSRERGCYQDAISAEEGRGTNYHIAQEINTEINGCTDDLQQVQKTDTSKQRDISTPDNHHIEVQPKINSSTPKPSHSKHMVEFPLTSPIDRDNGAPDYGPYHTPTSLRKQVVTKNKILVSVLYCVMKVC